MREFVCRIEQPTVDDVLRFRPDMAEHRNTLADNMHDVFNHPEMVELRNQQEHTLSDLWEMIILRGEIAESLRETYPDLDRDWQSDLPTDMGLLEMLRDDLSLVFGMR